MNTSPSPRSEPGTPTSAGLVDTNGIQLAYERFGDQHSEPLLLVHGWGCHMIHWAEPLCQTFVDRGFSAIRIDNRDMGHSSRWAGRDFPALKPTLLRAWLGLTTDVPYTLSDMAGDLVGLLDNLEIPRAHVLGVSLGGMVAQTMALEHPDRVITLTSVMSSPSHRFFCKPAALSFLFGSSPRTRSEAQDRSVSMFKQVGSPAYPLDEAFVRRRTGLAWDRDGGRNPRGLSRQLMAAAASGSRRKALRTLTVPTLVIHGEADPVITATAGRETARCIPGSTLRLVPGMGHNLPEPLWAFLADELRAHADRHAR